ASTPNNAPARPPPSAGRSCNRPVFGAKPQRSAKTAASSPIDALTRSQSAALTNQIGTASEVAGAKADKSRLLVADERARLTTDSTSFSIGMKRSRARLRLLVGC